MRKLVTPRRRFPLGNQLPERRGKACLAIPVPGPGLSGGKAMCYMELWAWKGKTGIGTLSAGAKLREAAATAKWDWRLLRCGPRNRKIFIVGRPGGAVVERLPLAQVMILGSRDRVPCRAPRMEPASPSACVSASLSVFLMNKLKKTFLKKNIYILF